MSVRVLHGDMREVLPTLSGLDACVCDPPYHLTSIVKRFSNATEDDVYRNAELRKTFNQGASPFARQAKGFMGKQWDGGDIAFSADTWRLVYDALKPGAHLLAFGGSRTFARMFCAIEEAGFEYRDTLSWMYGTGFPKSHNLQDEWKGWGTALKPAWEPIGMFRKPLIGTVAANVLAHGTGAINVDACRVGSYDTRSPASKTALGLMNDDAWKARAVMAGSACGRWPANVLHDGSDEVEAAFAAFGEKRSPQPYIRGAGTKTATETVYGEYAQRNGEINASFGDTGTASRFFYSAKASKADRAGSKHPTVKPLTLMRWLVRLITPPGGTVLDCFAGSGTTGEAAMLEGFNAVLIEREDEYITDINRRIERATQERTTIITTAQLDMFA